ncbi:putative sarcosine oxidase [Phaeomoniella chlamydospora]|uniref:Putative sarcosine oxidase n=1 Tax=Phaeomoniella chlamydospora TaxID=158046 RepID=A0A0G2GPT6_PHACM|nr:putative sarcosine oxidase [Phaeomoniella chlamydospora]
MEAASQIYLIVGAGIFGASAALHLKRSQPSAQVLLVDKTPYPCPSGASHDLNKIVRADYDSIFYMKLGLEALEHWKADPIFNPYYHESGMLIIDDTGWGRQAVENYRILGAGAAANNVEIMSVEDATTRFPIFKHAEWSTAQEAYFNSNSGWVEADRAMKSVIDNAIALGVEYIEATVQTILFAESGSCIGAQTVDGRQITADKVLLCTGPYTAKILADSAPMKPEIQINYRMVAVGAVSCTATYDPEERDSLETAPVLINTTYLTYGDALPPLPSDGRLKFNFQKSFTNTVFHEASNQIISIPPDAVTQSTWSDDVPEILKQDCGRVVTNTYGDQQVKGLRVESYRICWYVDV